MSVADELRAQAPDTGAGAGGGGPAARRILVPVRLAADAGPALALAASLCDTASGMLRLVHVRIYDPPVRGGARFYPQTAASRLLLGSVPDRVMRKSGCPVLAVHPGRT
jgi:nucleotide-binding universal stress UspA family protein